MSQDEIPATPDIHCAHDRLVDITELVANPRNPNKHPDKQVALLAKIIRHQGWRAPVVVSKRSGFIVAGHGRLEAAKLLNIQSVPVNFQEFKTEADEWAHLIADNRIAELSEINSGELVGLLKELEGAGEDLDLSGFDELEVQRLLVGTDRVTGENSIPEIWQDLPACDNADQLKNGLIIYFDSVEAKMDFGKVIGQRITDKTKSCRYPPVLLDQLGTKEGIAYVES